MRCARFVGIPVWKVVEGSVLSSRLIFAFSLRHGPVSKCSRTSGQCETILSGAELRQIPVAQIIASVANTRELRKVLLWHKIM